ncbi:hypothetical protein POKO110462_17425 [Pontibacter korlensis]|uniref:Uncharacterized protein n=1 Tax=Pontibacter korlensis TaxID=400092 RepID=A0A0E3UXF8_9BACT|nr:hypothetical protein [Pontibacter korlensis]AKD03541.1 hypothetical protein PKOR_10870 [Pontibacter korlensis]
MSARSFELLLETAFDSPKPPVFEEGAATVYTELEQALRDAKFSKGISREQLSFKFERLRLGVAIAFVKAFLRLADNEKSKEVLEVLQDALKAKNSREIDKIVQKRIAAFDNLYHEIFVNPQREEILHLFESTLDAGTKEELDELIMDGLELLTEVDWNPPHDTEDDDDIEPFDEDFLKSL